MVREPEVGKNLVDARIETPALALPVLVVWAYLSQLAALLDQLIEKVEYVLHALLPIRQEFVRGQIQGTQSLPIRRWHCKVSSVRRVYEETCHLPDQSNQVMTLKARPARSSQGRWGCITSGGEASAAR